LALSPLEIPEAERKLVAWWKFDEAEGSNAGDSSGNERAGTLIGNPQWQPTGGKAGGALVFDGVDDYVETGYSDNLPVWTIAAWVNSDAAPASQGPSGLIHWHKNLQINWDHQDENFRGAAGTQVAGNWYAASFKDLQARTWYHLAATYDGENLKAYKDGVLITNTSTPIGNSDAESETLKIGRHSFYTDATNYFGGTLDDVRVYNYALSADDMAAIYAGQEPPTMTAKTEILAASGDKPETSNYWMLVLAVVAIAAVVIGLAIRKQKPTA
jgi:hypothetical protein